MPWQLPNIGSRVNREVPARFWERPEVKFLRATRQIRSPRARPWRLLGASGDHQFSDAAAGTAARMIGLCAMNHPGTARCDNQRDRHGVLKRSCSSGEFNSMQLLRPAHRNHQLAHRPPFGAHAREHICAKLTRMASEMPSSSFNVKTPSSRVFLGPIC
jgi:hypothetical protein